MPTITWRDAGLDITCPVCSYAGSAPHIADVECFGNDIAVARCPQCGSVRMFGQMHESSPNDATIDAYIEAGAGVETIAAGLLRVEPSSVRRFLDVGCNYGFGMDIGSFLFGWETIGFEPSLAGRRGAAELGLDIRNEYLDEGTDVGAPFDLILASEVVEHVPDPIDFLRTIRNRLSDDGVVVLTTPAAEIVDPAVPEAVALVAMSPGFHVFLASAAGLELMLRAAGFAAVAVERVAGTLFAIAAASADAAAGWRPRTAVVPDLAPYYDARAASAPPGSALASGMATRHLRAIVNRGDFAAVEASAARAVEALRARHNLDLQDPSGLAKQLDDGQVPPWNLAGAAYALGMTELLHHERPDRAHEYLDLTLAAVDAWRVHAELLDADLLDLRLQAARHRVLAVVRHLPTEVAGAVADLAAVAGGSPSGVAIVDEARARALVELVAVGEYDAAQQLAAQTSARAALLAVTDGDEPRRTGLDALFSLGMLAMQTARPEEARRWYAICSRLAAVRAGDVHIEGLLDACRANDRIAAERGAVAPVVERPASGDQSISYGLDVYWTDTYGTYLQGWAHAGPEPVEIIRLRQGDAAASQPPDIRKDLQAYWPQLPAHIAQAGFSLYVEGQPQQSLVLELETPSGVRRTPLVVPRHPLPAAIAAAGDFDSELIAQLADLVRGAPPGPVLGIGLRTASGGPPADVLAMCAGRRVVNVDVHLDEGVDVVADAHRLSHVFQHERFAVAMSMMVFEHLAAPWLVAAEINRILVPGGLTLHGAPSVWPEHAQPTDFWRFTQAGLRELFGSATGFEVIDSGSSAPVRLVPEPQWRAGHLHMPTLLTDANCWVSARKVRHVTDDLVRWPYDAAKGEQVARTYPVDGLAPRRAHPRNHPAAEES
jgi:2-polyprenyl-3-methyl-5-hydroxy-6-metoxy-1,4-benzoquinol methylase